MKRTAFPSLNFSLQVLGEKGELTNVEGQRPALRGDPFLYGSKELLVKGCPADPANQDKNVNHKAPF